MSENTAAKPIGFYESEDAIVEIAGKTGDTKRYHDQLVALDQATVSQDETKVSEATQALINVFGKFTPLVVESWRGATSIRENKSNSHKKSRRLNGILQSIQSWR